jgi:hypothetical protein
MRLLVRQKGGLGNQLFQYAAGLYFARRYNGSLEVLREPDADASSFGHPRPCQLLKFKVTAPVREVTPLDHLLYSTSLVKAAIAAPARLLLAARSFNPHFSTDWVFQQEIPEADSANRLYLKGFFQAHQYPQAVERQLRAELVLRDPPSLPNVEMLDRIRTSACPVSLHMRRGDYTVIYNGRDALPLSYYGNAIAAVRRVNPDPTFFVFSDDIAFARQNLPASERIVFVDHNGEEAGHEDLRLMAACRHHIIANSTFSWWGAWLNPDPAKQVYAPDRWLDPAVPHPDLIPPEWHRLSASS